MAFKVGDKVRLVKVPEAWDEVWGIVGAVATVLAHSGDYVRVDYDGDLFGWYWNTNDIELATSAADVHTPADLAMALELADLVDAEGRSGELDATFNPIMNTCGPRCLVCTAEWLRGEVIAALYEGAH